MSEDIKADSLEIPEFEKDEDYENLKASIEDQGLLHPVTVRLVKPSEEEPLDNYFPRYEVIAGRKRALALKELGHERIPCTVRELDDNQSLVLGIHENLRRANLPWWDQANLVAELHQLRQTEHGKPKTGRPKKGEEKSGWTMRDTADELDAALGSVSESILLADAVQSDPQLRNIKDRRTALKIVRQKAKQYTAELEQAAPVDFAVNEIYNGSATDILRQFDAAIFDAVVTDPPWERFKDEKYVMDEETRPTFKEIYRVMKHDSFLFMFLGMEDFLAYKELLPNYGFEVSRQPLFWHKINVLSRGTKSWEYARDYEFILLAVRGTPVLATSRQLSAIKSHPVVPVKSMVHPNEKPVDLVRGIVEECTHPGAVVLDPFAGSGSHLEAIYRSGRRYIGIERDHQIYSAICERMTRVKGEK
jgi:site-specific DNA-methyltransferase (adenine-specific)